MGEFHKSPLLQASTSLKEMYLYIWKNIFPHLWKKHICVTNVLRPEPRTTLEMCQRPFQGWYHYPFPLLLPRTAGMILLSLPPPLNIPMPNFSKRFRAGKTYHFILCLYSRRLNLYHNWRFEIELSLKRNARSCISHFISYLKHAVHLWSI